MGRQIVVFGNTNTPVYPSDSAAGPSRIVEADAAGQVNISGPTNCQQQLIAGAGLSIFGQAISASQTADKTSTFYEVNAAGGAVIITLPAVATVPNQVYVLVKTDASANAAQFKGNGAEVINGANTQQTTTQYGVLRVRANAAGTAWYLW